MVDDNTLLSRLTIFGCQAGSAWGQATSAGVMPRLVSSNRGLALSNEEGEQARSNASMQDLHIPFTTRYYDHVLWDE